MCKTDKTGTTITQDRKEQLVHPFTVRPRHQISVNVHTLRQSHGQKAGLDLHGSLNITILTQEMLEVGIIEPSKSEWSFPIVLIKKTVYSLSDSQ